MFEELDTNAPLYTPEEMQEKPMQNIGDYPTLKTVGAYLKDEQTQPGKIDYNSTINDVWNKVNQDNILLESEVFDNAINRGAADVAGMAAASISNRLRVSSADAVEERRKVLDISTAAAEKFAASQPRVTLNNTPARIAQVTQEEGQKLSLGVQLEKDMEEGRSWAGVVGMVVPWLTPFTGSVQNIKIQNIVRDLVGPEAASIGTGQSDDIKALGHYLHSLPEDEKAAFAVKLFKRLKEDKWISPFSNNYASMIMSEVLANEDQSTLDKIFDGLNKVFPALDAVGVGIAAKAASRGFKAAAAMNSLDRAVAKAGGKDILVSQEALKIGAKAALEVPKELSGVNTIESLARLTSSSIQKILPEGISTAPTSLQKTVISKVEQTLRDLEETLGVTGKTIDDSIEIRKAYSPAINPSVARLDFVENTAKVWFKPTDAPSFTTSGAAEGFVKLNDPDGKLGLRIVPDTINSGFLVAAEAKKAKQAELALAEAQLAELTAKDMAKAEKKAAKKPKPEVKLANTIDQEARAIFENEWASLPNLPKEGDITIFKAGGMDEWTTDEAAARAFAATNKTTVRAISIPPDKLDVVNNLPKASADIVKTKQDVSGKSTKYPDKFFAEPYINDPGTRNIKGQIFITRSVPAEVDTFIARLGKVLVDLHGEQPLLIVDEADMVASGAKIDQINANIFYSDTGNLKDAQAFFSIAEEFPGSGIPLIVMKKGSKKDSRHYMETFAHEYAHYFVHMWGKRYSKELQSIFNDWATSKGYSTGNFYKITLEDAIEYRSSGEISYAMSRDVYMRPFGQELDWSNYFPYATDKDMDRWLSSWHEFFSENFAKWALTDELPTTILGQTFKRITDQIKELFRNAAEMLPGVEPINKRVAKFMNDFITRQKAGLKPEQTPEWLMFESQAVYASRTSPTERALDNVTRLRSELQAIEDAERGLASGWLVEATFGLRSNVYAPEDIASIIRPALGDWALGTSNEQYVDRLVGVMQQSRYQKLLTEFVRKPLEKLNKAEKANVDSILVRGDLEGVEYDDVTLRGAGLNEKERTAYYTFRAARNLTYKLRNDALSKSLDGFGYKSLTHPGLEGRVFARQVELGKEIGYAVDVGTGKSVRVNADFYTKSPDYVVKELAEPATINGRDTWYIVAHNGDVKETTITDAIPYRVGEYSRKYTDPYFVKFESGNYTLKDGTPRKVAHRTATTKGDAEGYVKAYNEGIALHRAGRLDIEQAATLMEPWGWRAEDFIDEVAALPEDAKLSVVASRTNDDYVREGVHLGLNLHGERGDTAIKNVRGEVNAMSPLDSLATEIGNTAYMASVTEWRDAHIKKWFNTFNHLMDAKSRTMAPEDAFFYTVQNRGRYFGTDKSLLAKQRIEDYLLSQLRVATKEEQYMDGFSRLLAESVEVNEGPLRAPTVMLGAALRSTKDWTQFARTISFHSFFGFNPVQLVMQGMNAFNAVAMHPIYGAKAGFAAPLYRMALMSDQEEIWRKVATVNKLGTLGVGMDIEEFVASVRAIRRSGLLDGINTTSLYGAETGKMGLYNGVLRKAGSTSAAFFNLGEEGSRLISFDIARREWKDAHPGTAWNTDEALREILERQDDLTQNMTIANTAFWQKGALSVPLQFFQYPVKLAANVAASMLGSKRAFTRTEVARLLAGHLLVLGTAGAWMMDWEREALGDATKDMTPEQKLYIQQGIVAGVINSISLASSGEKLELALGSRFNTFRFYEDFVDALLAAENPAIKVLAGASGGALYRATDNFSKALTLWSSAPVDAESFEEGVKLILTGSLSVANNYNKAVIASAYDTVISANGNRMYAVNSKEQFMMKWGIPPAAQEELTILYKTSKEMKDLVKRESDLVGKYRSEALIALKDGDTKKYEMYRAAIRIRLDGIPNLALRQEVMKAAYKVEASTAHRRLMEEIMLKQFGAPNDVLVHPNLSEVR